MRFRYIAFDPERHGRRQRFEELQRIFNHLLLRTGGDVEEALEWIERLGDRYDWFDDDYDFEDFRRDLEASGRVRHERGVPGAALELTGTGERLLRRQALERVFGALASAGSGDHRTPYAGGAGDETEETRAYAWGDPCDDIAWTQTMRNAILRTGGAGGRLAEADIEVREREISTGCATVLLVDVSHSMVLYGEDRMTPAREVALALHELIRTRFRKDSLDLVLFGDEAEIVPLERIPYIHAGPFHTNTKAGLQLAQEILHRRQHVNRQIFMVTDGKPSAIDRNGEIYKNPFGLDEEIANRTLDEALRCRRAGITVTTFMLAQEPILVEFVEEFARLNRGRAYFTGTEGLASTLFVDYLRNRRARLD